MGLLDKLITPAGEFPIDTKEPPSYVPGSIPTESPMASNLRELAKDVKDLTK